MSGRVRPHLATLLIICVSTKHHFQGNSRVPTVDVAMLSSVFSIPALMFLLGIVGYLQREQACA